MFPVISARVSLTIKLSVLSVWHYLSNTFSKRIRKLSWNWWIELCWIDLLEIRVFWITKRCTNYQARHFFTKWDKDYYKVAQLCVIIYWVIMTSHYYHPSTWNSQKGLTWRHSNINEIGKWSTQKDFFYQKVESFFPSF